LVLWGFTGVGKTSLLQHTAKELKLSCLPVQASRPIDDRSAVEVLLSNVLAELGYERALTRTNSSSSSDAQELTLPMAKAGIEHSASQEVISAIEAHTLERAVARALAASSYRILFIDAFEFIPNDERQLVVEVLHNLMHELSDRASENKEVTKIAIAGIADAAQELVPSSGPITRRVQEIHVPTMSKAQLADILNRGAKLLGIIFDDDARKAIVAASDGFPFYAHHFAFYAVEEARLHSPTGLAKTVSLDDYQRSLEEAIEQAHLHLTNPYLRAIESSRGPQTRKRVLEAVANTGRRVSSLNDIRESYLRRHPDDASARQAGFFQRPIRELVQQYGLLVELRQASNEGPLYRFRDPLMRAYVRLHALHPGLIPIHRDEVLAG
jgi:Holliday junction resolvasome RuvABC ATP-dependent DNA helicase subunit